MGEMDFYISVEWTVPVALKCARVHYLLSSLTVNDSMETIFPKSQH